MHLFHNTKRATIVSMLVCWSWHFAPSTVVPTLSSPRSSHAWHFGFSSECTRFNICMRHTKPFKHTVNMKWHLLSSDTKMMWVVLGKVCWRLVWQETKTSAPWLKLKVVRVTCVSTWCSGLWPVASCAWWHWPMARHKLNNRNFQQMVTLARQTLAPHSQ